MAEVIKINFDIDKKALDEKLRELDATFRNLDNLFEKYAGKVGTKLEAKFDLLREQFDEARLEYTDMSTKFRQGLNELDNKEDEVTQKTGVLSSSFIRSERDIFFMSAIITELTNIIFSTNNDADRLKGDLFNLAISVGTGYFFGGVIGSVIALVTALAKTIGDIVDAIDDVVKEDKSAQFDIKRESGYLKGFDMNKMILQLQPQESKLGVKMWSLFDNKLRDAFKANNAFIGNFAKFIDYAHKNNLTGTVGGGVSAVERIAQIGFYDKDFFDDAIEIKESLDYAFSEKEKGDRGYKFFSKILSDGFKGLRAARSFGLIQTGRDNVLGLTEGFNKFLDRIENKDVDRIENKDADRTKNKEVDRTKNKEIDRTKNKDQAFYGLLSLLKSNDKGQDFLKGISLNPTDYPTPEEMVTKNKKTNPNNIVGPRIQKITINIKKSLINEIAVLDSTISGLGDNAIQNLILSTITDAINDSQVKKY